MDCDDCKWTKVAHRERLPDERKSLTHKFTIKAQDGDVDGYVTLGFYEDGRPGELFVKMAKEGSQVSGFIDAWATAVSLLLQHHVPLEQLVTKFRGSRFPPSGYIEGTSIYAQSPIDYICKWLA